MKTESVWKPEASSARSENKFLSLLLLWSLHVSDDCGSPSQQERGKWNRSDALI